MKKRIKIKPELVKKLAACGLTEESICDVLEISNGDFSLLMNDAGYSNALDGGKAMADFNVTESLFNKATGYKKEKTIIAKYHGRVKSYRYFKHCAASITAIKLWLKNRCPEEWDVKPEKSHSKIEHDKLEKLKSIAAEYGKDKLLIN